MTLQGCAFLRLTVVEALRRADLAVACDVPLGALLPDLLAAVETDGPASSPLGWALVGDTGEALPLAATPGELHLLDGAVLRLTPAVSAPAPATVTDLTAAVADDWERREGLMGPSTRAALGCAALIALAAVAASYVIATSSLPGGNSLVLSAGLVALAATALLGFVPLLALHVARLAEADDDPDPATPRERAWVTRALSRAHGADSVIAQLCGIVLTISLILLARVPSWWVFTLVALICLIVALRSLVFPEAPARAALAATALSGVIALVFTRLGEPRLLLAIGSAAILVISVACLWRPAAHTAAHLRRLATFVEAVAVVATVPILLGALGVYSRLLGSFGT